VKGSPVVGRSVSLFHAGKVYDYIDTIGEVTIFEPAQKRFTIMNGSRMIATQVDFDQITKLLKLTRFETQKRAKELEQSDDAKSKRTAKTLRFMLEPQFDVDFDRNQKSLNKNLRLTGVSYRYEVKCASGKKPEIVDVYLRYADWIKKLNFCLNPLGGLPGPRLQLNRELQKRGLLPVEVKLSIEQMRIRAEHTIHWNLDRKDRQDIHRWDSRLNDPKMKMVSFGKYQNAIRNLTAKRR
jgi:hypothetical protein